MKKIGLIALALVGMFVLASAQGEGGAAGVMRSVQRAAGGPLEAVLGTYQASTNFSNTTRQFRYVERDAQGRRSGIGRR